MSPGFSRGRALFPRPTLWSRGIFGDVVAVTRVFTAWLVVRPPLVSILLTESELQAVNHISGRLS